MFRISEKSFLVGLTVAACASATSCSSSTGPTVPPVTISCPAQTTAVSADGKSVRVSYAAPVASGGQAPVTTTCTPASGELFDVGSTLVRCNARDIARRSADCAFSVTVEKAPQLDMTNFLAFGDSITAGVIAQSCPIGGGVSCSVMTTLAEGSWRLPVFGDDLKSLYPRLGEESSSAYPRQLLNRLSARYLGQTIAMSNQGSPGESVDDGRSRLPATLSSVRPQVLLLQEGANDINRSNPSVTAIVDDLRAMVREARGRGLQVFVGTVLPQRQNACRGYDFCDGVAHSVLVNTQLRAMIASEGATLVDLYPLFDGKTDMLLGLDGLHPNDAGYKVMADAFFEAITGRLEH